MHLHSNYTQSEEKQHHDSTTELTSGTFGHFDSFIKQKPPGSQQGAPLSIAGTTSLWMMFDKVGGQRGGEWWQDSGEVECMLACQCKTSLA